MPWTAGVYTRWNSANTPPYWVGDASIGVKIEASRHDTQDQDFQDGINACLTKDGTNAASANLNLGNNKITNLANGTVSADAATLGQVTTLIAASTPTGTIVMYTGVAAPAGWFLCDGTAQSRTTYSALWDVFRNGGASSPYGNGDGSTTFNIPNLQQRFPLGKAASGTGSTLGGTGGAIDHTHTSAAHTHTVASHTHTINSHTHTLSDAGAAKISYTSLDTRMSQTTTASYNYSATTSPDVPWAASSAAVTTGAGLIGSTDASGTLTSNGTALTTDSTTPGATGANNPPYLVVNYIIKW